MFQAARLALIQMPEKAFRSVALRSLLLTVGLFAGLWFAAWLAWPAEGFTAWGWLNEGINWLAGAMGFIAVFFLLTPVASLFAGIFLDEIAGAVERRFYGHETPGRDQPLSEGVIMGLKFAALVIVINIVMLPLHFIFPFGVWIVNGYLLGREYFEMVAVRYLPMPEALAYRKKNRGPVFLAGVIMAVPLTIPIVNFLVPLFGTAFMVHVYKKLAGSTPQKVEMQET